VCFSIDCEICHSRSSSVEDNRDQMAAAERIEFMGVIRQQRSRLLDYLLPGHVASRSLDRASCGNSQQAQLQKLWRKQTPAAKALLRSNPIERLVQRNVFVAG